MRLFIMEKNHIGMFVFGLEFFYAQVVIKHSVLKATKKGILKEWIY
jgi:hypothetical protein